MRKWTYLVATLLMAGTTATFTGCIDTDEPEGIVNLRGAKSELIKAEAAVKLVEVKMQKAQVANMELQNKALELANQKAEYDNQLKALDVKLKELDVELKQAKNEAEKARLQAEIAQSNANKKAIENQMALEAEAFKVAMLNAQTATAQAQAAYEQAIQDIELAKLTLSDAEQQQITTAQLFLTSVASVMNGKYQTLANAQTAYYNALVSPTMPSIGKLQAELATAQAEVEAAEIMLNAKAEMLALAEDFDAAAWDTKKAEYKKEISQYESEKGKAELEKTQIKNKEEYKAAVEDITKKTAIESDANAMYNGGTLSDGTVVRGAWNDSIDAMRGLPVNGVSTRLAIKRYASEPINASLKELFSRMNPFTSGYNTSSGVFSYGSGSYAQNEYFADLDLDDITMAITPAVQNMNTIEAWIKVLNGYTVDANGVAWSQIALDKQKKDAADREKEFNAAKADWDILVAAVKDGKATNVPTSVKDAWDLEKAVKTYNDDYKALVDAIAAYNTEYDNKYKAAYDKHISDWKAAEKKKVELDLMMAVINAQPNLLAAYNSFLPPANPSIDTRINTAKTVLNNLNAGTGIPGAGAINDELDRRYDSNKATIEGDAKRLGLAATATVSNAKIVAADTKVKADIIPLQNTINEYKALASYPYGQIPANALTIIDLTGTGNFYQTKTETDGKVHYEALRKNISTTGDDNEYAKLTATKLKADGALRADLGTASRFAFGNVIPTTGEPERLTPVEKEDIRNDIEANPSRNLATDYGKLGAWMYSEDMVQYYTDLVEAKDLIDALIVQLEGVKADLKVEIQTNSEKIQVYVEKANEARNAYYEAKAETEKAIDTRDALTAEVQAKIEKFTGLIDDVNALITTVDAQIASIAATGGATGSTVAEIVNYWKKQVASAEYTVESKKQEAAAKQKAIDLFKDDKYTAAFDLEQKKNAMDSASDEYLTAKDVYDMALSQLKALITALTK